MQTENAVIVRRIRSGDWDSLRALRLAALKDAPLAFGSTFARENESAPLKWKNWALRGAAGNHETIYVAVNEPGQLVGMIGAYPEEERSHIWGMWVHPEYRGRGIGGELLDILLSWLTSVRRAGDILLEVNAAQEPAVGLYRRHGFVLTGRTRPLGHHPPTVVQEMVWKPSDAV
jgi:ribosomal protein S18 acetylase RimI-like enzyme